MSDTEQLLKDIAQRGFAVTFVFEPDGTWEVEGASAGDFNCPIQKQYDPSDGHGWSHVKIPKESWPILDKDSTFDNMVRLIHAEIMKVEPGAPYK